MRQLLAAAERPIVIAGGSRWSEAASAALMRFAERFDIPVATSFRRTHVMDPLHPSYAGDLASGPNPKLLARVKAADLVLLLGGRLGEWPSQSYTLLDVPVPKQTLIHVHPGIEELGRVYRPHLAIHARRPRSPLRSISSRRRTTFAGATKPRPRMPTTWRSPRSRPRCRGR